MRGVQALKKDYEIKIARSLRKNQTDADRLLWSRLRAERLQGVKFRRQHPVGPYFADFCSMDKKLVVELDGGQHAEREVEDAVRTTYLQKLGYRVLRVWNHDVFEQMEAVLEAIHNALLDSPSPHPSPSKGEGDRKGLPSLSLSPGREGRVRENHSNSKRNPL